VTAVLVKTTDAQNRGVRPADVTAFKGDQVTFNCSGSDVTWFLAPRKKIFTSPATWNTEQGNKYEIVGSYDLIVKDVDPNSDSGTYKCDTNEVSSHLVAANLVILGNNGVKFHLRHIYYQSSAALWIFPVNRVRPSVGLLACPLRTHNSKTRTVENLAFV